MSNKLSLTDERPSTPNQLQQAKLNLPPPPGPPVTATTWHCIKGHSNPTNRTECRECGSTLPQSPEGNPTPADLHGLCSNGHHNPANRTHCRECGVPLQPSTSESIQQQLSITAPATQPAASAQPSPLAPLQPQPARQIDGEPRLSLGPGAPAVAGALSELQPAWAKLPTWGKVAAVAVPGFLLLIFVMALAGGCSSGRDKDSYDYGYQKGSMGFTQSQANGTSKKQACEGVLKVFLELPTGKNINAGDAMDGCMDALNGHPLGPG